MKGKRHVVKVMRPTSALDSRGQLQGEDETLVKEWPCSIETVFGNESFTARTLVPLATHRLKGYGIPSKPFREKDYALLSGRRFDVQFINDVKQNGVELELLCQEVKDG